MGELICSSSSYDASRYVSRAGQTPAEEAALLAEFNSLQPAAPPMHRPVHAHQAHQAPKPSHRPVHLPRDHHRTEKGIGARAFGHKVGDTYTTILNLRGSLEVRKDKLSEASYKMFGVLINQQERILDGFENKPGTSTQVAELRRAQQTLEEISGAIDAFEALAAIKTDL